LTKVLRKIYNKITGSIDLDPAYSWYLTPEEEGMTDRDKLITKLGKIKAHAESAKEIGNEAEAEHFASMLQQLLLRHKLEMTDLEYAAEMQSEPIIEKFPKAVYVANGRDPSKGHYVYADYPDVEITSKPTAWVEMLANIIADHNSCRILVWDRSSKIGFVGHKTNVAIAEYLFITMLRAAHKISDTAAKKFRREWRAKYGVGSTPPGYRESFLTGFIGRINTRLNEQRNQFGKESLAIVRVNREALEVKSYVDGKYKKTDREAPELKVFNHQAYRDGQNLANQMDINGKAVKEAMPNQQLPE
jgi:hypothetical protein